MPSLPGTFHEILNSCGPNGPFRLEYDSHDEWGEGRQLWLFKIYDRKTGEYKGFTEQVILKRGTNA